MAATLERELNRILGAQVRAAASPRLRGGARSARN